MASSTADPDRMKPNLCSNPSRKVRIVAKIRGFTDQESQSVIGNPTPWICVHKPKEGALSEKVTISFGEQPTSRKDASEVDYCYEQNEDIGVIFSREIKPLVSEVFDGLNATIIAYGARGSGKTYTVKGSEEKPGLAVLAMAEIISMAKEFGKSVGVSLYEVFQDHVYDILDPKHPEVQVLDDAQGKVNLRGLSQVSVKSISEFQEMYFNGCNSYKPAQKIALELPQKSHKGLIIYVSSCNENFTKMSKMNFVDLAGYEDVRRSSSDGSYFVESSRINKSLYALLNVVYAINANESRVPYRESKLTRMLQDSLGKNHVLMLTCLNPSFCRDTLYAVSSASRSCQGINRVMTDSSKKVRGSTKQMVVSSLKNGKPSTVSTAVKKQSVSRAHFSEKKASCMVKGRKLFDEGNLSSSKQAKSHSDDASTMQSMFLTEIDSAIVPSLREEESAKSDMLLAPVPKDKELSGSDMLLARLPKDEDVSPQSMSNHLEATAAINSDAKALTIFEDCYDLEKENTSLLINEGRSPPLSARLREISNNLRSLYSSTPLCKKIQMEVDTPSRGQVVSYDIVEPKTPTMDHDARIYDKLEVAKFNSPWETLNNRSSGIKHSLVKEYLKFLNTASKEELKGLRGIGEKRATYILELRQESPEPFKNLDDLQGIGLSGKQIKGMMKKVAGELLS
ncbi:unnamed protein product [Ilex paraguariensis]|uniref:Kinesin motor domain-containing protein n=1 Tax=Ilex paraguariensis TaxID=185542 RepID=A0ABC8UWF8_9AQUA